MFSSKQSMILTIFLMKMMMGMVSAGPMETCGEQKDCIEFSFEEFLPSTCSGEQCEWEVCLTINHNENCVKTGAISHTCLKTNMTCNTDTGFADAIEITDGDVLDNFGRQCQTGKGGDSLSFLLKDGAGCNSNGIVNDSIDIAALPSGASATCAPRDMTISSCTGNAAGKECVWTVKLPGCSSIIPPPQEIAECPKGKNVCSTLDCHCVMGSATPQHSMNLAYVLIDFVPGQAGFYPIAGTCENGKALSNAVLIDDSTGSCAKEEPEGNSPSFRVEVDAFGNVLTPFSMKCGKDLYYYGDFPVKCNARN